MASNAIKPIPIGKTSFNCKSVSDMTFAEFERMYKKRVHPSVDLKKLFTDNGGKLKD